MIVDLLKHYLIAHVINPDCQIDQKEGGNIYFKATYTEEKVLIDPSKLDQSVALFANRPNGINPVINPEISVINLKINPGMST
jgi:hypothetical protein